MLSARSLLAVLGIAFAGAACASGGSVTPPTQPPPTVSSAMPVGGLGQVGDTIYFVDLHVKHDARDAFESFVRDRLWPAFQRATAPGMSGDELLRRIRFMQPQGASEDSTFTYTFILDPVVQGFTYNVLDVLSAAHGEAAGLEQYNTWTATWDRDFTVRRFVQAR